MNLLKMLFKIVIFAVVAIVVLTIAGKIRQASAGSGATATAKAGASDVKAEDKLSAAGFFLLTRDEANNNSVVIMSPPNCPSDEAMRARALADALAQSGIPSEMRQELHFEFHNPEDTERVNRNMANVVGPLVLVRGWAKGNPMVADIVAQYQSGRGK